MKTEERQRRQILIFLFEKEMIGPDEQAALKSELDLLNKKFEHEKNSIKNYHEKLKAKKLPNGSNALKESRRIAFKKYCDKLKSHIDENGVSEYEKRRNYYKQSKLIK